MSDYNPLPTIETKAIDDPSVAAIGYDEPTMTVEAHFKDNTRFQISRITPEHYEKIISGRAGAHLAAIMGNQQFKRVKL